VRVEHRVATTQPFERHHCVLFLLVAVVREDFGEISVGRRVHALVVPVHRFELFHDRSDRAVVVDRVGADGVGRLVQRCAVVRHGSPSGVPRNAAYPLRSRT